MGLQSSLSSAKSWKKFFLKVPVLLSLISENFHLSMTLKVHIILHHYHDYFDWTGRTMRFTNGEFVESSNYSFKKEERTHGFKVKRAIGTPKQLEKSLKFFIWQNSKRVGLTSPSKLQLMKYSPCSIPYSSHSLAQVVDNKR